jgi:GDPmannose 4,6-dehydratase
MKTALVTGITGQDGSYLAEYLVERGYKVFGLVRRTSGRNPNLDRVAHLADQLELLNGDLLDQNSLINAIADSRPDEIYNLAAQSFVPASFSQPVLTGEFTALGVTRILEAIRVVNPRIRFYQASSSEMFGKVETVPQNETTKFHPRSPYGVAKLYAHWITVNFRESYGIFAVSGILFNHECVTAETPVVIRRNGLLDILPIEEIVPHRSHARHGLRYTTVPSGPLEVWDRSGWTDVRLMTATWNEPQRGDFKPVRRIAARGAVFAATRDHVANLSGSRRSPVGEIEVGEFLELAELPPAADTIEMSREEAWFLGAMAAEGHVAGRKARFSSADPALIERVRETWRALTGGVTSSRLGRSGFEGGQPAVQLDLTGSPSFCDWLRTQLYTRRGHKRIPFRVLNSGKSARLAFLEGYKAGDGLAAGHGAYLFKSFKTNSATLAQGLWWLAHVTLSQRTILCVEEREGRLYYQINLNSPNSPGQKGAHLRLPLEEVVKVSDVSEAGWVFDLETATGTFQAGVGSGWIHNSPRRGAEFVTRKITLAAARIAAGKQKELRLGNLDAQRDWGFTGDYVEAMHKMLQQPEPIDYVIGTGETHTVREFVDLAFSYVGLDWKQHVVTDPKLVRPAEVDLLIADPRRAREELGWSPKVSFRELVKMMVDADVALVARDGGRAE